MHWGATGIIAGAFLEASDIVRAFGRAAMSDLRAVLIESVEREADDLRRQGDELEGQLGELRRQRAKLEKDRDKWKSYAEAELEERNAIMRELAPLYDEEDGTRGLIPDFAIVHNMVKRIAREGVQIETASEADADILRSRARMIRTWVRPWQDHERALAYATITVRGDREGGA